MTIIVKVTTTAVAGDDEPLRRDAVNTAPTAAATARPIHQCIDDQNRLRAMIPCKPQQ